MALGDAQQSPSFEQVVEREPGRDVVVEAGGL
jgi:hypothetical protein